MLMRNPFSTAAVLGMLTLTLSSCGGAGPASLSGIPSSGASAPSAATQLLYVPTGAAFETAAVSIYPSTASGNATPLRTITGSLTRLADAVSVAIDPRGYIYVANTSGALSTGPPSCITIYPPDANGNVAPVGDICGPNTQFRAAFGHIAFDTAGNLYVETWDGPGPNNASILVFAPGVTGDAAPIRVIDGPDTGMSFPIGIAIGSDGTLYVANDGGGPCGEFGSITEYAANASGNAAPAGFIDLGSYPRDVALDAAGHVYADLNGGIAIFAAGARGKAAPIARIVGPDTQITGSEGIALDAAGDIYAGSLPHDVLVYPPLANLRPDGDTAPIRVLDTALYVTGITVH